MLVLAGVWFVSMIIWKKKPGLAILTWSTFIYIHEKMWLTRSFTTAGKREKILVINHMMMRCEFVGPSNEDGCADSTNDVEFVLILVLVYRLESIICRIHWFCFEFACLRKWISNHFVLYNKLHVHSLHYFYAFVQLAFVCMCASYKSKVNPIQIISINFFLY